MLYLQWEAMLISYLARRVINVPFDGISTLVTATDFKITLMPGTSIEDAFKTSTDPFWQKAWTDRIEPFLDEYKPFYGNACNLQSSNNDWIFLKLFASLCREIFLCQHSNEKF